MFQLRIGDKTLETLKDFEEAKNSQEAWAAAALHFCKAWLQGDESFELQTSGSTGTPKLIQVQKNQMIASALATQGFLGTTSSTRILNCLDPSYIAGKMNLVRALVWDCAICCEAPSNQPISQKSQYFEPDFITLVPTQVTELIANSHKAKNLKHILVGGAPLSEKLQYAIASAKLPAWQTYGMTETVSHIALAKIDHDPLLYATLPSVTIGQNSSDCLWVKSPMSGDKKIQTTDLIELKSMNSFVWKGRLDFVINSGGIKLHPELLQRKIEGLIEDHFPDAGYFLCGVEDEKLGEKMVLFIETGEKAPILENDLMERFDHFLAKYEIPKAIYFLEEFIKTPSGKLDRKSTIDSLNLI